MNFKSLAVLPCLLIIAVLGAVTANPAFALSEASVACGTKLSKKIPVEVLSAFFEGLEDFDSKIKNDKTALIVDYTQPSTKKRAYLVNLRNCTVEENEYVIHGGRDPGTEADPRITSPDGMLLACLRGKSRINMTRPGFMITAGLYESGQDWPKIVNEKSPWEGVVLRGLEGRNDDVEAGKVVLHEHSLIPNRGGVKPVGQGCPAFPAGRLKNMLDQDFIDGTLVYLHVPQCK